MFLFRVSADNMIIELCLIAFCKLYIIFSSVKFICYVRLKWLWFLQVLAMSSRSWLSYYYQNRFHLTPLSYESLEYASGFSSEQCPEGIVAISTNTLRILALEKLGAVFNQVMFCI